MADRNLRIRMLLEAGDRMTRPMREAAGGASRLAQSLRGTQERLQALERAQADVGAFRALKAGLTQTKTKMEAAKAEAARLGREMAQTANPTRKLTADFNRAKREAAALTQQHGRESSELQQLRTRLSAAGVSTRDLVAGERRLRTEIAGTSEELRQQMRRLQQATDRARRFSAARERFSAVQGTATGLAAGGAAAIGTGMIVAAPVVNAAKGAMSLEEAMAGVAKVTNMAGPSLARMTTDVLDLSNHIPMAADGLANIAAAAGAAGIGMDKLGRPMRDQRQQLLEFTNDAAEMGIAFDMAAEDAGSTMAKWRTAFELPQTAVRALGDKVNALTNTFGGKASDVSDILTRIGPLGKVAGVTAPQIAALGSTLNSIGVESEVAATGIKNTMLALTKGEAATKGQAAAFKTLGLEATDVAQRMQKDAGGTIIDVMQRIGKLQPAQRAGMLTELFGSESVAAIAPLLTNLDGLKQRLSLVGDASRYAGSMHGEFLSRINTTTGATDLAMNGLRAVNIELGQQMLPTIKAAAQWVSTMTSRVRDWAKAHPGLAKAIAFGTAALAALFLILGGGAILIAGLIAPFAALSAVATALGIGLLPVIGIAAAVVAGIVLLGAAAYYIYDNWGAISAWFGALWEGIKRFAVTAIQTMVSAFLRFTPLGLLISAFMPALNYLRSLNLTDIGRNLILGLINGVTGKLAVLKSTIMNAGSAISNWFKEKLGIHSPSRVFHQFGGFMMQGLDNGIQSDRARPVERIRGLASDITKAMALGAATPAIAAPAPAAASRSAPAVAPLGPVTIVIQQQPGQIAQDLARLIEQKIKELQRRNAAAGRSSFSDTEDYGALT